MTISITFWYETKEEAIQVNDTRSSVTEEKGEEGSATENEKAQQNNITTATHARVATAAEQIALRRDIEESVMEALDDASKVKFELPIWTVRQSGPRL